MKLVGFLITVPMFTSGSPLVVAAPQATSAAAAPQANSAEAAPQATSAAAAPKATSAAAAPQATSAAAAPQAPSGAAAAAGSAAAAPQATSAAAAPKATSAAARPQANSAEAAPQVNSAAAASQATSGAAAAPGSAAAAPQATSAAAAPKATSAAARPQANSAAAAPQVNSAAAASQSTSGAAAAPGRTVAPAAAPLPFDQALSKLVQGSLDVQRADANAAARREEDELVGYNYLPTLDAAANVQRLGGTGPTGLPGASTVTAAGLVASLNLYHGGADAAARTVSAATAAAAALARDDATALAEERAALALIDAIERAQELGVAQRSLAATESNVGLARKLFDRGLRPAQDVQKVEIDAANEAAKTRDSALRLQKAQAALATIAGAPVAVEAVWPWRARLSQQAPAAPKPAARRADQRALDERLRSLAAATDAARAGDAPRLDVEVGYDFTRYDYLDDPARQWHGKLALAVPLFDRFSARSATREAALQQAAAALDLASLDRELAEALATATAAVAGGAADAAARDQTLDAARKLYERSMKSFQTGVLSANELALDQDRLLAAELNALHGWASVHRDFVALCRALGERLDKCGP